MRYRHLLVCLGCSLIACCSSPPELAKAARAGATPTRIQSAHGLLSEAQSAAILKRLQQRGDNSSLARHVAFEEALLDRPLVAGNQVRLLQDGTATYAAMFAAIAKARDHINLETYIFEGDEVGQRFLDLLLQKQAEGIQINIIYDSVGSLNTPHAFFERMRTAGMHVLEYNPINPLKANGKWLINNRDHRKLLVVDGQIAFLGGVNISSVYSRGSRLFKHEIPAKQGAPWRDTHLQLEGPVVADFQHDFLAAWERQGGETLTVSPRHYYPTLASRGKELVRAITSTSDEGDSQIYLALLSAISHAEKQAYLTNAYFVPDGQFLQTLIDAAARGVDVRLILPGSTDSWVALQAGHSYYQPLLAAGVKIYERRGALMHAKTAVVDGVWSTVGSSNLDWRSFIHNDELNAEVLGPDFAAQMLQMFEYDAAQSNLIELAAWEKRPLHQRIKEWSARLWAYWL